MADKKDANKVNENVKGQEPVQPSNQATADELSDDELDKVAGAQGGRKGPVGPGPGPGG